MSTPIEIPSSKRNLAFMLLGAAIFVALGIMLLVLPGGELFDGDRIIIRIVGLVAILFFGGMGYLIARRYRDQRIGLRIDERGITDHSSGVSIGLIEWADIEAIDTARMGTERFLVLRTHQPEKYIERATNGLMRGALRANHRITGSPLNISARALDISFEELHTTLQAAWERQSAA